MYDAFIQIISSFRVFAPLCINFNREHWVNVEIGFGSLYITRWPISLNTLHMQVLFIAPVHGKKKPQLSYPDDAKETDTSVSNPETLKQNSEFFHHALNSTRVRLKNIVKRPKRSDSKVCRSGTSQCFAVISSQDSHYVLWIVGADLRLVPWPEGVHTSARMATWCCWNDQRIRQLSRAWQYVGNLFLIWAWSSYQVQRKK